MSLSPGVAGRQRGWHCEGSFRRFAYRHPSYAAQCGHRRQPEHAHQREWLLLLSAGESRQVVVRTGIRATADFSLELGEITESVQVSGQAPLLETSTAAVSRNVQQR